MTEINLKVYTLEYPCHGNQWQIKVLAFSAKEAKTSAAKAWCGPISKMKVVSVSKTLHGTFGAERVYKNNTTSTP